VSARFEELAWAETAMGAISLRRRLEPSLKVDVFEVKLGDEFLMSSLFTVAEIELARLGLAQLPGTDLDIVVGGLGLGYTAQTVLDDPRVRSLLVVEALADVIDWHQRGLLPNTAGLMADPRTQLVNGDFFALSAPDAGFDSGTPDRRFHAILVDIDHTPQHVLHPSHVAFYTPAGLRRLTRQLHPGGVFALWSDDPPDPAFNHALAEVFASTHAHVVTFPNPHTGGESTNTVYVATCPPIQREPVAPPEQRCTQVATSPRCSATASRSGNRSGVTAKAGTPIADSAAAFSRSNDGAPLSDSASSTTT
jgi:spermidine synthase